MAKYSAAWIAAYSLIAGCGVLAALYLYSNNSFEGRARFLGLKKGLTEKQISKIIKDGQEKRQGKIIEDSNEDSNEDYSTSEKPIESKSDTISFESFESFDTNPKHKYTTESSGGSKKKRVGSNEDHGKIVDSSKRRKQSKRKRENNVKSSKKK